MIAVLRLVFWSKLSSSAAWIAVATRGWLNHVVQRINQLVVRGLGSFASTPGLAGPADSWDLTTGDLGAASADRIGRGPSGFRHDPHAVGSQLGGFGPKKESAL